jgi:hypothetical protein
VRLEGHRRPAGGPYLGTSTNWRRITMHAMHSFAGQLVFGLWEGGRLVRLLNVLSEDGIVENVGEPLDFEVPFWAGAGLVRLCQPGAPQPGGIDTFAVRLHGFRFL